MEMSIKDGKLQNIFVVLLATILIWLLGKNIFELHTVWELFDEAGYLSNAAYFAHYDWSDIRSICPYYAYGYSILLIPIFFIADTGVQLIQGAYIVNVICSVGVYFLQICIMKKICVGVSKAVLAIMSFTVCLYPFIISNTLKVNCEMFLTFWYLLLALMLYYAVKTSKIWAYGLLGIGCAFIFFIHTRSFVIIGTVLYVIIILGFKIHNKNFFKKIFVLLMIFAIFFIGLYEIKLLIINSAASVSTVVEKNADRTNLITIPYITHRLETLFSVKNVKAYFLSFVAKLFYLIVGSATMIVFGYVACFKEICKKCIKSENVETDTNAVFAIRLYLLLGTTLMLLVTVANGLVGPDDFTYFFYGRYYEYTITPLILYGIYSCIYEKQSAKKIASIMLIIVITGLVAKQIINYLNSSEIHIDTTRASAIVAMIAKNDNYEDMILYAILFMVLFMFCYLVIHQVKRSGLIILGIVFIIFWQNSFVIINTIKTIHSNSINDTAIAKYITVNSTDENIYIVEEPYLYNGFYSRMQVLIKDQKLHIILPEQLEDIEEGAYIITYKNTSVANSFEKNKEILVGDKFTLFQK